MKSAPPQPGQGLHRGQLWKLKSSYVYIVATVKSNIQFKLMDSPNQHAERTLTSGTDTLSRYLASRKGKLVNAGMAQASE